MREYLSDAIVLSREPSGELDLRISLFTKKFGKLTGLAKSTRKVTSKLAGHLEPGNLVKIRVIEKSGLQIVDAIKQGKAGIGATNFEVLNRLLHAGEADPALWALLISENFGWGEALRLLGWDPKEASCSNCGREAGAFFIPHQEFFCRDCVSGTARDEVIYI